MGISYLSLSTWAAKALGYQAVSDKDGRVLGGDGQTLMQNLNQADPKVEDSLRMVRVELQVVDFLGDRPQPQDAFLVVPDLELHKLQRENAKDIEDDTLDHPITSGASLQGWKTFRGSKESSWLVVLKL